MFRQPDYKKFFLGFLVFSILFLLWYKYATYGCIGMCMDWYDDIPLNGIDRLA